MTRMHVHEVEAVRALYELCHPGWPQQSPEWFECMNSLVIRSKGKVVAWTALALAPPPLAVPRPGALCAWLIDTCVAPSERGKGWAGILMDQRLSLARVAGAQIAIGAASDQNLPMLALLRRREFAVVRGAQHAFPDGSMGNLYIKHLGGV